MFKIPRSFCITLKETPLRTEGFVKLANESGLTDVSLFYGVFGPRMKLTPTLSNELECPGQNIFMTEGSVGCYLSHYILWNVLLNLPEDEFFIMEDDAVFAEDFLKKFECLYNKLPSPWDMVYVGWLPHGGEDKKTVVDEGICIRQPCATHAYLIKKTALRMACEMLHPCCSPIDLTIRAKLLPRLTYYVLDPSLVGQRSYLAAGDPVWNSLGYDWKTDLYGVRRKLLKELSLGEGWHNIEKNNTENWRWSKDSFTIQIPPTAQSVVLECSTPIENSLKLVLGNACVDFPLTVGNNIIDIHTENLDKIEGKLEAPFIPSEHDQNSLDARVLGICLKKVSLVTGLTKIDVDVSELSPPAPLPISFKL